ncbi:hypothetical protein VUR80DRAFT_7543 [Thermomyces stellatus]
MGILRGPQYSLLPQSTPETSCGEMWGYNTAPMASSLARMIMRGSSPTVRGRASRNRLMPPPIRRHADPKSGAVAHDARHSLYRPSDHGCRLATPTSTGHTQGKARYARWGEVPTHDVTGPGARRREGSVRSDFVIRVRAAGLSGRRYKRSTARRRAAFSIMWACHESESCMA